MGIFIALLAIYIFVLPSVFLYYAFKSWKKGKKKTSISFLLIAFFIVSPIVCDIGCQMCGLEKEEAYKKVIRELEYRHLNIDNVKYTGHNGTCNYSFLYEDKNKTIDFVILSTWLHGIKTTFYIEDKNISKN